MYACSGNILIGFLYRPPDCTIDWFDSFSENLEKVFHEDKEEIMIMADSNVDLLGKSPRKQCIQITELVGKCPPNSDYYWTYMSNWKNTDSDWSCTCVTARITSPPLCS